MSTQSTEGQNPLYSIVYTGFQKFKKATEMEAERCKICLLGEGGVGKSTLSIFYRTRRFVEDYDPTIEDSFIEQKIIDEKFIVLEVLDTGGSEYYEILRENWVTWAEAFVMIYSSTKRDTFEQVSIIMERAAQVRRQELHNIPFVMVGNKVDLEAERQVSAYEGFEKSCKYQVPFFETSSKFGSNVEEVFCEIVREFRKKRKENSFLREQK